MTNRDTDNRGPVNRGPDNRDDSGNRKETALATSSLTGGAVTSLAALGATLNSVDTASVVSGSERPLLIFKSRDSGGIWTVGQKRTIVEEGSSWAADPRTFQRGFVCFDADKKVGEKLLPVSLPMPDFAELPDKGFPWQEQWAVNMKCIDGADAGKEVIFKASTVGGRQAVAGMIAAVRDRINGGQHNGKPVPIASREVRLSASAVREDREPAADDRRLDAAGRSGADDADVASAAASHDADAHLEGWG